MIAIAGVCTLGVAGTGAAASGAAFVRVNQVGYPAGASKRAYLLSSVPEPGATFRVTNARGRVVLTAPVGAALGRWSARFPEVYAIDFSRVRRAWRLQSDRRRPRRRVVAGLPDRGRQRALGGADPALAVVLPERARRPGLHPLGAAHRARPPERRARHDLPDAQVDGDGQLHGRPAAARRARSTRPAAGGTPATTSSSSRRRATPSPCCSRPCATSPRQIGACAARLELHRRGPVRRATGCCRMWDDKTRTLYYQVGIGEGNDHDHRRPRHLAAAAGRRHLRRQRPAVPLHPPPPGLPGRRRPGRPISPNLAGRDAAAFALCYQVYRRTRSRLRRPLPALGRAHLRPRRHDARRGLLTAIPYDFYPETEWRDDLELGATELAIATAHGDLPAGLPHRRLALLPAPRGPLGARLHHRPQRRRRHAQPVRRERAGPLRAVPRHPRRPATRPGWR